jgi:hypothetical protein
VLLSGGVVLFTICTKPTLLSMRSETRLLHFLGKKIFTGAMISFQAMVENGVK